MAHEVETIAYAGATPWHGLGNPLPEEGLRNWRVACETAGLNWQVERQPLFLTDGRRVEHVANVRTTDGRILGVVGPDYEILQNEDAFSWFEPILESGEATVESAGALRNGSRVFALAKIQGTTGEVSPGDFVQRYVLLSHSHDGTLAVRVGLTDVRVVCNNTLQLAHKSDASQLIRLKHTKNLIDNLKAVREVLDTTRLGFFSTLDQYRKLASKDINASDVRRYVEIVLEVNPEDQSRRTKERIDEIVELAYSGRGNSGKTVWDAYNGITEWTSWQRGRDTESRVNSLWFGDSAKLNQRALELGLELASS